MFLHLACQEGPGGGELGVEARQGGSMPHHSWRCTSAWEPLDHYLLNPVQPHAGGHSGESTALTLHLMYTPSGHKGPPIPSNPAPLFIPDTDGQTAEEVETSSHAGHRTEQKDILQSLKLVQAEQ